MDCGKWLVVLGFCHSNGGLKTSQISFPPVLVLVHVIIKHKDISERVCSLMVKV